MSATNTNKVELIGFYGSDEIHACLCTNIQKYVSSTK